jgi:hypothetical protein
MFMMIFKNEFTAAIIKSLVCCIGGVSQKIFQKKTPSKFCLCRELNNVAIMVKTEAVAQWFTANSELNNYF